MVLDDLTDGPAVPTSDRAQPAAVSCSQVVGGWGRRREQQPLHSMDRSIGAVFFVVLWGCSLISFLMIDPKARNRESLRMNYLED